MSAFRIVDLCQWHDAKVAPSENEDHLPFVVDKSLKRMGGPVETKAEAAEWRAGRLRTDILRLKEGSWVYARRSYPKPKLGVGGCTWVMSSKHRLLYRVADSFAGDFATKIITWWNPDKKTWPEKFTVTPPAPAEVAEKLDLIFAKLNCSPLAKQPITKKLL